MTSCEQMPLIEFLKAELNAGETENLLRHVENCTDCRERLQVMAAIAATYPERQAKKRHTVGARNMWLLAAGILVAILAPLIYLELPGTGIGNLATQERYPAGFPLITRGGVELSALEQVRREAYETYRRGDYDRSCALLKLLPPDAETLFYLGVSQYFSAEPGQALGNLEKAAELDRKWSQPARWYRASAYLKIGQKAKAQELLRELVKAGGEYKEKAEELLGKLE